VAVHVEQVLQETEGNSTGYSSAVEKIAADIDADFVVESGQSVVDKIAELLGF
jgi:hypothetical protein